MPEEDGSNKHGPDTWSVPRQATRNTGPKVEHPSHL